MEFDSLRFSPAGTTCISHGREPVVIERPTQESQRDGRNRWLSSRADSETTSATPHSIAWARQCRTV